MQSITRLSVFCALAVSIPLLASSFAEAGPGDINGTNHGPVIQGGTYYNTPGSRTTFQNDHGNLWLKSGTSVRGLESDPTRHPTGNGGSIYLRAPQNVVRLDGDIDVSGLKNGTFYIGIGGRVFVDAKYLYQNGKIFANGTDAGLVQFNVNSAIIGQNARIAAMGYGGYGGNININARDKVSIGRGAILNSSGQVISAYDTNVINIEGGAVNNQGMVIANGTAVADYRSSRAIARDTATVNRFDDLKAVEAPDELSSKGGTIRLVTLNAKGDIINGGILRANGSPVSHPMQSVEKPGLIGLPEDGGTVILASVRNVSNTGSIQANGGSGQNPTLTLEGSEAGFGSGIHPLSNQYGGHGGTVSVTTLDKIENSGVISVNGGQVRQDGGNGGLLVFSSRTMSNKGWLQANGGDGDLTRLGNGGQGGLVVFNQTKNPADHGTITANGGLGQQLGAAGAMVAPRPATLGKDQLFLPVGAPGSSPGSNPGSNNVYPLRQNELLLNLDNGILLSRAGDNAMTESLVGRLHSAVMRTVAHPEGFSTAGQLTATTGGMQSSNQSAPSDHLTFVGNFIVGSPNSRDLHLNLYSTPLDPRFFNLNSSTVVTGGSIINDDAWIPGTHVVGQSFHDVYMNFGGGHLSWLAGKDIINNGYILSRGMQTAGSINMTAGQDLINNRYMMAVAVNQPLLTAFSPDRFALGAGYQTNHGGGFVLNAGRDFVNNAFLNNYQAFYLIHRVYPTFIWPKFLNAAQMGATIEISAGRNVNNNGLLSADALTFRHGQAGLDSPANAIGGLINIRAGKNFLSQGQVTAIGQSYFNPQEVDADQEVYFLHFQQLPEGTTLLPAMNGLIRVNAENSHLSSHEALEEGNP